MSQILGHPKTGQILRNCKGMVKHSRNVQQIGGSLWDWSLNELGISYKGPKSQ